MAELRIERESRIIDQNGGKYIGVPVAFREFMNITEDEFDDFHTCVYEGKHGMFIVAYSPLNQDRWRKRKQDAEKNQMKF